MVSPGKMHANDKGKISGPSYGRTFNQCYIEMKYNISRPDAVFPDPAGRWGGGFLSPPPAICRTTRPILNPKMAFDSSRLGHSEYVVKFYLDVTDDATGRAKG